MSKIGASGPLAQSLLAEALKLSISDRVALIERIVSSFDKADPSLDLKWLKEAELDSPPTIPATALQWMPSRSSTS